MRGTDLYFDPKDVERIQKLFHKPVLQVLGELVSLWKRGLCQLPDRVLTAQGSCGPWEITLIWPHDGDQQQPGWQEFRTGLLVLEQVDWGEHEEHPIPLRHWCATGVFPNELAQNPMVLLALIQAMQALVEEGQKLLERIRAELLADPAYQRAVAQLQDILISQES